MAIMSLSYYLFGDAISPGRIMSVLFDIWVGMARYLRCWGRAAFYHFFAQLIFLKESSEALGLPAPKENPLNLFAGTDVPVGRARNTGYIEAVYTFA